MSPATRPTDGAAIEPTLAKGIYEWLRERIIDGTLKPGERIREREVAEKLKVSRIPIREALPQLESEGYVTTIPRRGAIVTRMARQDVDELFEVRSSLEVLAAKLAAERCAQGADTTALSACLAEAEEAVAEGDNPRIAEANSRLHEEVLKLTGNSLLQHIMVPISGRVQRLFHIVTERDHAAVHAEHVALCKAILAGKSELAEALAFVHVEISRQETSPVFAE
ncbi:GntR family transcriptional regulator [Arthrobacter ginkgonis]|uniref:GntR family transcriptional regulator n=1 Tax=Arthrobacter ginkgonis TaxID=1630594 RepID=A0ABP7CX57_9MICC